MGPIYIKTLLYIVQATEVSFRPRLTGCNKNLEVIIPPSWIQLDYVVVVAREYLQKQLEHLAMMIIFTHWIIRAKKPLDTS